MKRSICFVLLISVILALSGCGATNEDVSKAKSFVIDFFDNYKNGKINGDNVGDYILDNASAQNLMSLIIGQEEFSVDELRNKWGISEEIMADEAVSELSTNAKNKKLERFSAEIISAEKIKAFKKKASVTVKITHPVINGDIEKTTASELIYNAAGVNNADELRAKFFEERKLTDEEIASYEQEQFENEYSKYIIGNFIPVIIEDLIENAENESLTVVLTIEKRGGMNVITAVEFKE